MRTNFLALYYTAVRMDKEQKVLLAWSLAWEGTITIVRQSEKKTSRGFCLRPRLHISNADKSLLEKFQSYIGCGSVTSEQTRYPHQGKWKTLYCWTVGDREKGMNLLREILPFLPAKKRQAELLLEFFELRDHREHEPYPERVLEIHKEMAQLNRRGAH